MRRAAALNGCEIGGQDDIVSGKQTASKVDAESRGCDLLQNGIPSAVEDGCDLFCAEEDTGVESHG